MGNSLTLEDIEQIKKLNEDCHHQKDFKLVLYYAHNWLFKNAYKTAEIYDLRTGKCISKADGPDLEIAVARAKNKLLKN